MLKWGPVLFCRVRLHQPRLMFTRGGGHYDASACGRCGAEGIKKVAIRTVDTDVVVLGVASFSNIFPDRYWIVDPAFGTTISPSFIPSQVLQAASAVTITLH